MKNANDRNMNARNFGLRTSDLGRALVTAYRSNGANGMTTKMSASTKAKINTFSNFLKKDLGLRDLRKVTREHVQMYAEHLKLRCETKTKNKDAEIKHLSAGSAQEYMSKANQALYLARCDKKCIVKAVEDAGMTERDGIAKIDHSSSQEQFDAAKLVVDDRLAAILDLQREFGLRAEESMKIDAREKLADIQAAFDRGEKTCVITIDSGTKNGLPRPMPIVFQSQIDALKHAAHIQQNDRSMIPDHLKYNQFQSQCYREIAKTDLVFHSNRFNYLNDAYERFAGVKSPVRSGCEHGLEHYKYIAKTLDISIKAAREIDKDARLKVSHEAGHGRLDVTNQYLG